MSMYTRVFQWCAIALILYTVHLEIEFYNYLPLLLNCFFRWQELKEVGRSLPKSAKNFKFWNRDSLWKFTENDTPWKHHLPKVCPHIQECPYVVSCLLVTPSSQSKFFMLSMTALLLSETVMLLHIRIQCKQKLVHGIIRWSKIDSMYSKTSFL